MRFWPTSDANFCIETIPSWCRYCRQPKKTWKAPYSQPPHEMRVWYWTGLKTAETEEKEEDINEFLIKNWPKSRIRPEACLPIYYGTGNRFIRLTKADPAGFKCAPLPISLAEARKVRIALAEQEKLEKKLMLMRKKAAQKEAEERRKNRYINKMKTKRNKIKICDCHLKCNEN